MIKNLTELIRNALEEDLSNIGDITTMATVPENAKGMATIIAKEKGIIAGGFVVEKVFLLVDPSLKIELKLEDGTHVRPGQKVIKLSGSLRSILAGERTALNFLCRMSGIATVTSQFVKLTEFSNVKLLDTRKTTPGLRWLEKYAVRMGGGYNHRIGLYDMILIKENHITVAGGIERAVTLCHDYLKKNKLHLKIELEIRDLEELKQTLNLKVDRIMLDNMTVEQIKEAVALVNKKFELEISGGINLDNISEYARTGVNYISIGLLTHSAKALDFSLLVI